MRFALFACLFALCLGCGSASAQTTAAHPTGHQAAPAHAAPAIIPGSPLAALTHAATAPAQSGASMPTPFGTAIGLSISNAISKQTASLFGDFVTAVHHSTRLGPVLNWVRSFASDPIRRKHLLHMLQALLLTIVPGLVVERLLHFALARPRAALAKRAETRLPPPSDTVTAAAGEEDDEQGLADAEAGETERRPGRKLTFLNWGWRFAFGLLHFGLRLVPLIGFAVTVQVLISTSLITTRLGEFAVIGIANAYLPYRSALELLRFILAPQTAGLRLVPLSSAHAEWVVRWARLPLATGLAGYALVSVGVLLGLSHLGATVLLRLITLAIHVEIALGIWNGRRIVGGWISGTAPATSFTAGLRQRLGRIWHYPALFYVLALWIAWAAGVHDAFGVLLRIVVVVIAALIIGRLAWHGSAHMLERALERALPRTDAGAEQPLFARIHAYHPLLRGFVRAIIGILVFLLILQGWGVNAFGWLLNDPISRALIGAFIAIIITIAVALALWEWINIFLNGRVDRLSAAGRTRQAARLRTLLPMIRATLGIAIGLVAGLICLSKIGVNGGAALDPHHPAARWRWLGQHHPLLGGDHGHQHDAGFRHCTNFHRGRLRGEFAARFCRADGDRQHHAQGTDLGRDDARRPADFWPRPVRRFGPDDHGPDPHRARPALVGAARILCPGQAAFRGRGDRAASSGTFLSGADAEKAGPCRSPL
jgi:small conductance mechanosensitive channel